MLLTSRSEPNRNSEPAEVKLIIFKNAHEINSKNDCTNGTYNINVARIISNANPIDTTFQSMARRLRLNRKAINIMDAIPINPRINELKVIPLAMLETSTGAEMLSADIVNMLVITIINNNSTGL